MALAKYQAKSRDKLVNHSLVFLLFTYVIDPYFFLILLLFYSIISDAPISVSATNSIVIFLGRK